MAEIDQTGDTVAQVRDAAGDDRREVRKVGLHIDGDAVERHPAPQPHTDGGDLVFAPKTLVRPVHPDADAVLAALAPHVEGRQRPDDPFLEAADIGPHVRPPPLQVEHYIGYPLPRPVIGQLPAAPGGEHRETGVEQVTGLAAGPGGIERGVFQQPDQLGRLVSRDFSNPCFHGRYGLEIGYRQVGYPPFDRPATGRLREGRQIQALAVINHWLNIMWWSGTTQFCIPKVRVPVPTLDKVTVDLMVVLGTTSMPIHQVMRLSRGAIIELDATEADEVKILANNLPIASGVVLVDRNRIAVEVKQMLPRTPGSR